MENLDVTLVYESVEPDSIVSTKYMFTKLFHFEKLPFIECTILNEPINLIFEDVVYNPNNDTYYIKNYTSKNVERYYHGDSIQIMKPFIDKLLKYGWTQI